MQFEEKKELISLKQNAINQFKLGIRRINNGEDPRMVGEFEWAVKGLKDYQEGGSFSNQEMAEILEENEINYDNPEVMAAIEKNFVVEFGKAIDVCEWYEEIMGVNVSDYILKSIESSFIKDLSFVSDYKRMIKVGGFSEEFLSSKEVKKAAEKRLKDMIRKESISEVSDFIKIFKLENLDSKEYREIAEKRFLELVKSGDFNEASKLKDIFHLTNTKKLLGSEKIIEFYNKLD